MFERLTSEVRTAVVGAQEIARQGKDAQVTPTHLLMALTRGDGRVPAILKDHGIDGETIAEARADVRRGASAPDRRPLDDEDAEALRALGIDLGAIRRAVEASFGEGALDQPAPDADTPDPEIADAEPQGTHGAGPHRPDDVVSDEPVGSGRGRRFSFGGHPNFASSSKKSLELALREAIRDRSREVRAEHLALGILRADDDGIRSLLDILGVDARELRGNLEVRGRRTA